MQKRGAAAPLFLLKSLPESRFETFMRKLRRFMSYVRTKKAEKELFMETVRLENLYLASAQAAGIMNEVQSGEDEVRFALPTNAKSVSDLDIPWDSDNFSELKDQLREHLDEVNKLDPVTSVDYNLKTGKEIATELTNILKTRFGFEIDRDGFGTILFDEKAIASVLRYLKTDAEGAAILASPYVIKRGIIISGHKNHKNRGYATITFAAPAVLNGKVSDVAVAVSFTTKNRVHSVRVLSPDGNEFELIKQKTEGTLGRGVTSDVALPIASVNDSISQSEQKSNTFSEKSSENDETRYSLGEAPSKAYGRQDKVFAYEDEKQAI